MARQGRADRQFKTELDELEQKLFILKINFDKYFTGLERREPYREREEMRRHVRELMKVHITNSNQRFRMQTLRARWSSLDQYINRNLVMIERGTHPKMKFRAAMKDREREFAQLEQAARVQRDRSKQVRAEDAAMQQIFNKYVEARKTCGQSSSMSYDSVRDALRKQVRTMKSRYNCDSVKFRVTVENGKAKLKAVPVGAPAKTS